MLVLWIQTLVSVMVLEGNLLEAFLMQVMEAGNTFQFMKASLLTDSNLDMVE